MVERFRFARSQLSTADKYQFSSRKKQTTVASIIASPQESYRPQIRKNR